MQEHLRRVVTKESPDHYCGKTVQNELINLLGKNVLDSIIKSVKEARYYSIILDCTPDISHKEKMSFTIRFVEEHEGEIRIRERFLGYETVNDSSGEGLTELLDETLKNHNIDLMDCRG